MENENVCRACMIECEEYHNLFTYDDVIEQPLMKVLRLCTDIHVDFDDSFPKIICEECVVELRSAFNFREKCQASYETLRNRINQNSTSLKDSIDQLDFSNDTLETRVKSEVPSPDETEYFSIDRINGSDHLPCTVKSEPEVFLDGDYSNDCSGDSFQSQTPSGVEEQTPTVIIQRPYNSDLTFIRRLPPDVQLLVRRALEAERKRKERSMEGLEERQRRMALKFGVYVPPQQQLAEIRLKNAQRQRRRRACETPEERERRLCADAERKRRFRQMMKMHSEMKQKTQQEMPFPRNKVDLFGINSPIELKSIESKYLPSFNTNSQ